MKRLLSGFLAVILLLGTYCGLPIEANAETMTSSDAFVEILKQREGFEKYPYKDNSQWSIGYGTRVPSGKLEYYQKNGITEAEAEKLMRSMLKGFENSVVSLTEDSCDVVICRETLTESERAQIEDIISRKTDIGMENVVISTLN